MERRFETIDDTLYMENFFPENINSVCEKIVINPEITTINFKNNGLDINTVVDMIKNGLTGTNVTNINISEEELNRGHDNTISKAISANPQIGSFTLTGSTLPTTAGSCNENVKEAKGLLEKILYGKDTHTPLSTGEVYDSFGKAAYDEGKDDFLKIIEKAPLMKNLASKLYRANGKDGIEVIDFISDIEKGMRKHTTLPRFRKDEPEQKSKPAYKGATTTIV